MPAQITIPIGSKSARLEVRTKANIHLRSSDERISAKRTSADPNTDKMVYEITAEDTRKELQNVVITLDNPYTGQVSHPPPRCRGAVVVGPPAGPGGGWWVGLCGAPSKCRLG